MYTGLKENAEYSAQITPYHGKVNAEIICKSKDHGFYEPKLDLWLTVLDKSFGSSWRKTPTEKDWKAANEWVDNQLKLIGEYGTVIVTKPKYLNEYK